MPNWTGDDGVSVFNPTPGKTADSDRLSVSDLTESQLRDIVLGVQQSLREYRQNRGRTTLESMIAGMLEFYDLETSASGD